MKYSYPRISGGYRWNMLRRINDAIGMEPICNGDVGDETYLTFARELTTQEKAQLDALMADNPTKPPTNSSTVYIIRDVWSQKTYFESQIGLPYKIFYSESVVGSGNVDQVELHFGTLTTAQKNKVSSEYIKLISIKN